MRQKWDYGLYLKIIKITLLDCNIVINYYLQNSVSLYTFFTNKLFGTSLFWYYIKLWFTDQNCKLLEIEDKLKITLVFN